jgi:hypothetical protein
MKHSRIITSQSKPCRWKTFENDRLSSASPNQSHTSIPTPSFYSSATAISITQFLKHGQTATTSDRSKDRPPIELLLKIR